MMKKTVAVIGATGVAGQQFLPALAGHPFFEVVALAASERSAGKSYQSALTDAAGAFRSYCQEPLDPRNGVKYVLVSHNTKMGAAKGAILVAEYLVHQGHI